MLKNKELGFIVVLFVLGLTSCSKPSTELESKRAKDNAVTKIAKSSPEIGSTPNYKSAALINVELGLGYLQQGQLSRCKAKLIHALKLAPNISEPHSAMAYFLEMVGEFKDAEHHHKMAVKLAEGKGAVYNNYGAYLCRRTRYEEADKAFNQALQDKSYERTAEIYENAGICALKGSNPDKANEYLMTAIRHDPSRSDAILESIKTSSAREKKAL